MGKKTRYLQLSSTVMLEYDLQDERSAEHGYLNGGLIYTKLQDGHFAVFSPLSSEVELSDDSSYVKRPNRSIVTSNTINHLAVPEDRKDSNWFSFLDPDYLYVTDGNVGTDIQVSDDKVSEYAKHCISPDGTGSPFKSISFDVAMKCDSLKLYFVNGYDFSNIYGILSRVYLTRNDGNVVDLCNYFINKSGLSKLVQFMSSPIIFGDNIYDRYLEIRLPSLYELTCNENFAGVNAVLDISPSSSIGLSFAYVDNESFELSDISRDIPYLLKNDADGVPVEGYKEICEFVRSSSVRGVVPAEKIPSDNLGIYIAENPEYPYIEFCATWAGSPLSYDIVQSFNRGNIKLYDQRFIKKKLMPYEVDDAYSASTDLRKWVVMHEITCEFIGSEDRVLKTETYNMSQVFTDRNNETLMFQYRPVIFDETLAMSVHSIHARYTMRLMNIEDGVQFVKNGSISLVDGDNTTMAKFYGKGSTLPSGVFSKYDVHNKIIDVKRDYYGGSSFTPKTKYVKVFYDTSDIVLTNADGTERYSPYSYELTMSEVPKTYKFIFKHATEAASDVFDYLDLTDGYYKLYTKDAGGNEITIDPTYSDNMNLLLGEIEFNVNASVLRRLLEVPEGNRKMSVVAISDNNVISSMFDFTYTF